MTLFTVIYLLLCLSGFAIGLLYPQESETREVKSLDGLWNFIASKDPSIHGFEDLWYKKDLNKLDGYTSILMPVPSSYNDITVDADLRDHVGVVWYDRRFYVPNSWKNMRVWLRFGSVVYTADVWVNGKLAMQHKIGHLPFETEITKLVKFGQENKVTVACNNVLTRTSIPQGNVTQLLTDDGIKWAQTYTFDFFNYAGIHRPVHLYTTPKTYIDDITVATDVDGTTGLIAYDIVIKSDEEKPVLGIKLFDADGEFIISTSSENETLEVPNAKFWWPYLMDPNPGYQYTLEVHLGENNLIDVYRIPIGIRKLEWDNSTFTINNKPIYLHGFGRHEDSDIRGRGLDLPTVMRDYSLIKWVGGNAYRTSHYPYAEEIMDLADRLGIMIIDECPGVNIEDFSEELQLHHKNSIRTLISRDKNRPSVIAWSIANEPRSQLNGTEEYFGPIAKYTKSLDESRPITASINRAFYEDKLAQFLDIVSFNRYNSWYRNEGRLDMIINNVVQEAIAWRNKTNKPVLMSEYGADTMEGLHIYPDYIWSEEYQVTVMSKHFQAFDVLRKQGWFVGEFIWNFADFKTSQKTTRVGGNKKGIFTRNRQPKAAAHHLRKRYFQLAEELYNATIPGDLYMYTAAKPPVVKDEL